MAKGDDEALLGVIAIGAAAALVGLAIALGLKKPECPVCHRPIERGTNACPHCWAVLTWH